MQRSAAFKEAQRATGMRVMLAPEDDGVELYYRDGDFLRFAGKVESPKAAVVFMDAWAAARGDKKAHEAESGE